MHGTHNAATIARLPIILDLFTWCIVNNTTTLLTFMGIYIFIIIESPILSDRLLWIF